MRKGEVGGGRCGNRRRRRRRRVGEGGGNAGGGGKKCKVCGGREREGRCLGLGVKGQGRGREGRDETAETGRGWQVGSSCSIDHVAVRVSCWLVGEEGRRRERDHVYAVALSPRPSSHAPLPLSSSHSPLLSALFLRLTPPMLNRLCNSPPSLS